MNQFKSNAAQVFKAGRKLRQITQREMAKIVNLSQSNVSKIEKGQLIPDAGVWYVFCKTVGIKMDSALATGYVLCNLPENTKTDFKMGGDTSPYGQVKVKSCIPFIRGIENNFLDDEFNELLLEKGIDREIYIVPDLMVPQSLLRIPFEFLIKSVGRRKAITQSAKAFSEEMNTLYGGKIKDIDSATKYFNLNDNMVITTSLDHEIDISLNPTYKYSIEEQGFVGNFVQFKSEAVKEVCKTQLMMKNIKNEKVSENNYKVHYA